MFHQPPGSKRDYFPQNICIRGLCDQRTQVHHCIDHRVSCLQVRVSQPKPYPKTTVANLPTNYTASSDTNKPNLERAKPLVYKHTWLNANVQPRGKSALPCRLHSRKRILEKCQKRDAVFPFTAPAEKSSDSKICSSCQTLMAFPKSATSRSISTASCRCDRMRFFHNYGHDVGCASDLGRSERPSRWRLALQHRRVGLESGRQKNLQSMGGPEWRTRTVSIKMASGGHIGIQSLMKMPNAAFLITRKCDPRLFRCSQAFLDTHQVVRILISNHRCRTQFGRI